MPIRGGCAARQVQHTAADERTAIVDPDDDALAVAHVGDPQLGAEAAASGGPPSDCDGFMRSPDAVLECSAYHDAPTTASDACAAPFAESEAWQSRQQWLQQYRKKNFISIMYSLKVGLFS